MSAPLAATKATHTGRILLVDPDLDSRERVAKNLIALGHQVETCDDSENAIAELESSDFDIVLSAPSQAAANAEFASWMRMRHPMVPLILVTSDEVGTPAFDMAAASPDNLVRPAGLPTHLVEAVDKALAKRERRRELQLRRGAERARARHYEALSQVYERALENMHLIYQPVIRARTNCVVGYEALVRTSTPRFTGAGPFLAVASRLGRQSEIEDRVRSLLLDEFADREHWRTFFVNMDMDELSRGLLGSDDDPLVPYASRIVVEFGHELQIPDNAIVMRTLDRMRAAGYRIAAGDITDTTSALVRMRVLAPDLYKLGAAVVRRCDKDIRKQRYISEVIEMAHGEGALVVAQGIERPEERQTVVELGCDLLQGFLLGIPRASFG